MEITLDTDIGELSFFRTKTILCQSFYLSGIQNVRSLILVSDEALRNIYLVGPKAFKIINDFRHKLEKEYHFDQDKEIILERAKRNTINLKTNLYNLAYFKKNKYKREIALRLLTGNVRTVYDLLSSSDAKLIHIGRFNASQLFELKEFLRSIQEEYHFKVPKEELSLMTKISEIDVFFKFHVIMRQLEEAKIITLENLIDISDEELLNILKIGKKRLLGISTILEEVMNSVELPYEKKEAQNNLVLTLKQISRIKK